MDLTKYSKFRRMNGRLRISWSLGYLYKEAVRTGNWNPVFQYLTGLGEARVTSAMTEGKIRHEGREILGGGLPIFEGGKTEAKYELELGDQLLLVVVIDIFKAPYVGDYKSGGFNTDHANQLKLYREVLEKLGTDKYEAGVLMKLEADLSISKTKYIMFDENKGEMIAYMANIGSEVLNYIGEHESELRNYIFTESLI